MYHSSPFHLPNVSHLVLGSIKIINRATRLYIICTCVTFILNISAQTRADNVAEQSSPTITQSITVSASELAQFENNFPYQTYYKNDEQLVWQMTLPNQLSEETPYGDTDFNLTDSRKVFKKLKASGVDQTEFFEIPHLAHHYPPAKAVLAAIDFLDSNEHTKKMHDGF